MTDRSVYSITDAIVGCMQQPGTIAVAFVELKTGRAIAGDGIEHLDIDALTPFFTEMLLHFGNQIYPVGLQDGPQQGNIPEVTLTTKNQVHILYPLSQEGTGLYLYLVLDRSRGQVALSRRHIVDIDGKLDL